MELEDIKNVLYEYYEIESDSEAEIGCYINGKWLSIADVLEIIERYFN